MVFSGRAVFSSARRHAGLFGQPFYCQVFMQMGGYPGV